jgi:hypothetical protein
MGNDQDGGGTVQFTATTFHDSVLPVKLNFPPPLAHLGSDPSTFNYQWQLLTYAFDLPDPAEFPRLPRDVPAQDHRLLRRFVEVCEKTATYTVVAHKGGIILSGENGDWGLDIDQTQDEQTVGFATRFRQLHKSSLGKEPDFSTAASLLSKHVRAITDDQTQTRIATLEQWKQARAKLMNRPLPNIIDRMVLEKDNCPNIDDFAMYNDVNPDKIISLFNYGDLIHYGPHSEEYDKLAEDPELQAIEQNNFVQSMLGLVHLYFGFSELIRSAIGLKRAKAA